MRAPASESFLRAAPKRVPTVLSHSVGQEALRHAEPQARDWRGLQRRVLLARDHGVAPRAVRDVARERTDRVEREGKRKRAVGRHALLARLVADDAAQRRRNAGRAAGVGADRDLAHVVGRRDRRAGRRAAGHTAAVRRIARRAVVRVHADAGERELAHARLGDDDGAGRTQPPHDRCVGGCRRGVHLGARARARRLALHVEQVLDGDDRAVERPKRDAGLGTRVGGIRRGACCLRVDRQAGARPLAFRIGDGGKRLFESVANAHVITGRSTMS